MNSFGLSHNESLILLIFIDTQNKTMPHISASAPLRTCSLINVNKTKTWERKHSKTCMSLCMTQTIMWHLMAFVFSVNTWEFGKVRQFEEDLCQGTCPHGGCKKDVINASQMPKTLCYQELRTMHVSILVIRFRWVKYWHIISFCNTIILDDNTLS